MKLGIVCGSLLLGTVLLMGRPASAATGDVSIGGQLLFTIKAPAAGQSIDARVEAVTERLRPILADPNVSPRDIHLVRQTDSSVKVMVKNRLLITVTPEDARVNQLSTWEQARIWQQELRRTLPTVTVKPGSQYAQSR